MQDAIDAAGGVSVAEPVAEPAVETTVETTVEPAPEHVVEPAALRGGFGRQDYRPLSLLLILLAAISMVILIAALTAYLVRAVGRDTPNTPLAPQTTTSAPATPGEGSGGVDVVIGNLSTASWGTGAAPAALAFDDDASTVWSAPRGSGLTATAAPEVTFTLNQIVVSAPTAGAEYRVYGIPAGDGTGGTAQVDGADDLPGLPELAEGRFQPGQNSIDVDHDGALRGAVLYFPGADAESQLEPVELGDVVLVGKTYF